MWKPALGIAAVIVIALSGCAAGVDAGDGAASTAAPVETSAPVLTAAPATTEQEEYLTAVQRLPGFEDVTMAEALPVGEDVCAKVAAGVDPLTLTPVEGGTDMANEDMVMTSVLFLCADQTDTAQQPFVDRRVAAAEAAMNG